MRSTAPMTSSSAGSLGFGVGRLGVESGWAHVIDNKQLGAS